MTIVFSDFQIDPNSRPEFEDLSDTLTDLYASITSIREKINPEKPDVKVRRFPMRSRRSQTQKEIPKYSPSEYARHHTPSPNVMNALNVKKKSETPYAVGTEMSKLDPHYIPSSNPGGMNPFANLPGKLQGKIFGSSDLFCSCFEVVAECSLDTFDGLRITPVYRKAVSLIQPVVGAESPETNE